MVSHTFKGLENDLTYYARIFPVNPDGAAQSELDGQVASAETSSFPSEPTEYILTDTITASQTWTAPADGYYKIELCGASGAGGSAIAVKRQNAAGGGGGGGAVAISEVKLKAGDTIVLTGIDVGSTATAHINSSMDAYTDMLCTSGKNGSDGYTTEDSMNVIYNGGAGGNGGAASGGQENYNGGNGGSGDDSGGSKLGTVAKNFAGGTGGSAGYTGGNIGGEGAYSNHTYAGSGYGDYQNGTPGTAKAAFVKIYAGDTNAA